MWSDNIWSTSKNTPTMNAVKLHNNTHISRPSDVARVPPNVGNVENLWKPLTQTEGTSIQNLKASPVNARFSRKCKKEENVRQSTRFATDFRRSAKKKIGVFKKKVFQVNERVGKDQEHSGLLHTTTPRNKRLQWRHYHHPKGLFASPYSPYNSRSCGKENRNNNAEGKTQMYSPFDIITPTTSAKVARRGTVVIDSSARVTPKRPLKKHKRVLSEQSSRNITKEALRDLEDLAIKFDIHISSPLTRSVSRQINQMLSPVQTRSQTPQTDVSARYTALPTSCIVWSSRRERLV